MSTSSTKKSRHKFGWKQVAPKAFECDYGAVRMRIEQNGRDKWTFWARHPVRGRICDGVEYDNTAEAANAAENAAIDSLNSHMV